MFVVQFIRESSVSFGSRRLLVLCVTALSVLLARNAPPDFANIPPRLTVNADSHASHDHRPYFDHEDSSWGTAPRATLTSPLPVASPQLTVAVAPFVEIEIDGWHFNRPPPIGQPS